MSVYATLSDAIAEVTDSIKDMMNVSAVIVKTKDADPYCPFYCLSIPGQSVKRVDSAEALAPELSSQGNIVAVFATIR